MREKMNFDELENTFKMGFSEMTTIGKDGKDGKDGYTPIKGVDYYTDEEKAELVSEVTEEIKADVYNKEETDSKLENKADKSDTYTKSETEAIASSIEEKVDETAEITRSNQIWIQEVDVRSQQNTDVIAEIKKVTDKNFELIATQTVSPDTDGNLPNVIEFVLDEGLTDFYLFTTTKITASSTLRLAINDVSMWGNGTVSGLNSTTNTSMFYWNIQYLSFGEDKGGVISAPKQSSTIRAPQSNFYDDYSVYVPPTNILDKKANLDNIAKIKLSLVTSGVTFVNGSTFELWGVKKK